MYESFFGLTAHPFRVGWDPAAFFPASGHQSALLKLQYAIEQRSGSALLIAEPGLGKTLLARVLLDQLGPAFQPVIHIRFPWMPGTQLVAYLAELVSADEEIRSLPFANQVAALEGALAANTQAGMHGVVILDDAQVLRSERMLQCVRLLGNFGSDGRPDWTIVFIGQPEWQTTLLEHPALEDRLAVKATLGRFSAEETRRYIQHRLAIAGARSDLFDDAAADIIHQMSRGIPRHIHRIADLAMLIAFAEEDPRVEAKHVERVQADHSEMLGAAAR